MKAEILAIGTEMLFGQIVDTNSAWIASRMPALGIDLYYISTMGDNTGRMVQSFQRAWERSDLIITTGGLGPTEDDLTREAIAKTLGEEMYPDPDLERALRERFARRPNPGPMPERNLKQAMLIPSAMALKNPRGTAPGWWAEKDGRIIVSMPGVPPEMHLMWAEQVEPRLAERSDGTVILSRNVKTNGLGEGLVDEMISPLLSSTNPSIGVYAKRDGVHLRISAKAPNRAEAQRLIDEMEPKARDILGNAIWGVDDETPAESVALLLKEQGLTLAVMESCTGGLLSSMITDVPGSSGYFKGGIVSYHTDVKMGYGVDPAIVKEHGVISGETAIAMAQAVREQLGADIGIGVTGVAGGEPVEGRQPGTVFTALASADTQRSLHNIVYLNNRPDIKERAAANALLYLRRLLVGLE